MIGRRKLYQVKIHGSACLCGEEIESVYHFLKECEKFEEYRKEIKELDKLWPPTDLNFLVKNAKGLKCLEKILKDTDHI